MSGPRWDPSTVEMTYIQISKQLANLQKCISDKRTYLAVIQMLYVVLLILLAIKCTKNHWIPQIYYIVFT